MQQYKEYTSDKLRNVVKPYKFSFDTEAYVTYDMSSLCHDKTFLVCIIGLDL